MKKAWLGFVALAFCAGSASAQEPLTLRMGVIANSAKSISQLGLTIAQKRGFLAREGLSLEIVGLRGVQHQIEALDEGTVDISHTATPYLIQAVLKGSDSVAVVGGLANPIFALLAKPQIKTYADLKGKRIGLSLPVDTITIGTEKLLRKAGIQKGDHSVETLVGTPVRVACLVEGRCDAVPVGQPDDLELARKGYTTLGTSLEVIPHLQFNVVAARRAWAATHKDAMMRYVRAFGAAYRYMADPKKRDDVAQLITDSTGASPDIARQILAFYYEPYRGVMPKSAGIDMEGMKAVIGLMGEAGELQGALPAADRFVDLQYLEAAGLQD